MESLCTNGPGGSSSTIWDVAKAVQSSWDLSKARGLTLILRGNILIYKIAGYLQAATCLPRISPSTLWNSIMFDIPRKLLSRGIQHRRYRGMRISFHGERRQIPEWCHTDQFADIGAFQIETTPSWTFPFARQTFSVNSEPIAMVFGLI